MYHKINPPKKEPNATLVDANVEVPKTLIMNIYAISVFGTAVTLPIVLIIYKFSSLLEVLINLNSKFNLFEGIPSDNNENTHHAGNYATAYYGRYTGVNL